MTKKLLRQLGHTVVSNIQNAGILQSPYNEVATDCDDLIDFHTTIFHLTNPEWRSFHKYALQPYMLK
jgi:hypothetical protein